MSQMQHRICRVQRGVVKGLLLLVGLFVGLPSVAIQFEINYVDSPGLGFLDPQYGPQRRLGLEAATLEFERLYGWNFVQSGGSRLMQIEVSELVDPTNRTLGEASSPSHYLAYQPGFNLTNVFASKLLLDFDANGAAPDATLKINFSQPFEIDPSAPVSNLEYDFRSVVLHEFTHWLGFYTTIVSDETTRQFNWNNDQWSVFDSYLTDKNGLPVINPQTFLLDQNVWLPAHNTGCSSTGGSEGVYFAGPNAVATYGGPVPLFSRWANGVGASHVDGNCNPDMSTWLMDAGVAPGSAAHGWTDVELAMLADLGYRASPVSPIPEPETYALLAVGLILVVWQVRRRRPCVTGADRPAHDCGSAA